MGNMSEHEGDGGSEGEGSGGRGSGGEDLKSEYGSKDKGSNNEGSGSESGDPAVKMKSQAVGAGVAAVPLSPMEKLQRPSWTSHHLKLLQRWTTTSHRLPQSLTLMTRIQRMNRRTATTTSHAP